MFREINKIIENKITDTNLDYFCVIVGRSPSKGARSPVLWNRVFEAENKKIKMLPVDVIPEKLSDLFFYLQENDRCLGGAVAVPYKKSMFNFVKHHTSQEVKSIGAINCFFRKDRETKKKFTGTNTDGEAALDPIMSFLKGPKNKRIALIGMGGAGKAIWGFLNDRFGDIHSLHAFNRSEVEIAHTERGKAEVFRIGEFENSLSSFDLVINSTSAGSTSSPDLSPFRLNLLKNAKPKAIMYDIIYDPLKTKLLSASEKIGLKTINGLRMNLIQAVLAYQYTNVTNFSTEEIYTIMDK